MLLTRCFAAPPSYNHGDICHYCRERHYFRVDDIALCQILPLAMKAAAAPLPMLPPRLSLSP
jgi:hypothetical protein